MPEKNIFAKVADLYDFDAGARLTDDIPFYLDYATRPGVDNVLELACGTGRVTLPLARAGVSVTGLDLSAPMLAVLEKKLDAEPALRKNLKTVKGDMSDFSLDEKFDLIIIPFHTFQCLATEEKAMACLRCVRAHLSEYGTFVLDVFFPYALLDSSWVYPMKVRSDTVDPTTRHLIRKMDEGYRIDVENQVLYCRQIYQVYDGENLIREDDDEFELRYYYRDQIRDLVERAGLTLIEEFGWYDKSPVDIRREILLVCGK